MANTTRAGRYAAQPEGYKAFIPEPLPPQPKIRMSAELTKLLSDADRALGRVDGVASILPNPDLFVAMYVRHEAVFSSQIEGTQSSLEDVLEYEVNPKGEVRPKDVEEVVNYVRAMNHGLRRLGDLPLSLRLIREIHGELLHGVRGSEMTPGEFRRSQNRVGKKDSTIRDAEFVPPPPHEMLIALDNLEKFLHDRASLPILVHCGLVHAQFETIHPFLDGNGRIGRLLITLLLCERQVLQRPLLYISYYLKAHRAQYYDRLMAIRNDGDWEGWLKFFFQGIYEVSLAATETARAILELREAHRDMIAQHLAGSTNGLRLLDYLFEHPLVSVRMAQEELRSAYVTAGNVIEEFERLGILREITGLQRNRLYRFDPYLSLFDRQALAISAADEAGKI
ncbi:MAG TPA: Fic family protein [Syntrophobacteraceae bacterium]|nr:Fic family protein [Syntrophobacteraceae bacterium]